MPVPTTIDEVASGLLRHLGNELAFRPVCTRVMLRTGVNLREPRPDQRADKAAISSVMSVLSEMGYAL